MNVPVGRVALSAEKIFNTDKIEWWYLFNFDLDDYDNYF